MRKSHVRKALINRILVIRLSSLGDIILTSPTVLNLKLRYPEAQILFLTKESYASIAKALPGVARVVTISSHATLRETFNAALSLDDQRFDLIVDLSANARSWLITALINATVKVSYTKNRLVRERIVRGKRLKQPAPHTIDSYNSALRKIDTNFPLPAKRPLIDKSFYQSGASALPSNVKEWLDSDSEIVLISPGARHETKRAPAELFESVCRNLLSGSSVKIVSVCQSAESELSLNSVFPAERYAEIVDAPLEAVAYLLRQAQVTLSNDSAVAHLSSAVGTPVVALFGPTHSALGFSPRGVFDRVIENEEPCRPCSLHGSKDCSREERFCFTGLPPGEVAQAVLGLVESQRKLCPALFMDRDGTIIEEKDFLCDPSQVVFYENAFESLRQAQQRGYKLVIVTNQSGVARGMMSEAQVKSVNERVVAGLAENGVDIAAVYYAPGHPDGVIEKYRTADNSRKPSEGMFVQAALENQIDLRRSWVIGDRATDYLSARTIGAAGGALVMTGYGQRALEEMSHSEPLKADIVAADLAAAVSKILLSENRS